MDKSYLQAGEIVTTHGVRGEVKILPWADSPEFLLEFDYFYIDGAPYKVEQARVHKGCVLAKLQTIDDPAGAQALRGKPIWIDRHKARLEDGSVFIADLGRRRRAWNRVGGAEPAGQRRLRRHRTRAIHDPGRQGVCQGDQCLPGIHEGHSARGDAHR